MDERIEYGARQKVQLRDQVSLYLKHWKWFLLSFFLFVALAWLVIRYSTPTYIASGKIQIVDETSQAAGLNLFPELAAFGSGQNKVEDEIQIILSRSNLIDVVKRLGLNTRVYSLGNIRDSESYVDPPIELSIIAHDTIISKANFDFFIEPNSSTSFGFSEEEKGEYKTYAFGKNITTLIGDIVVTPNAIERYVGEKLKVTVRPIVEVAETYSNSIRVAPMEEYSNVLSISLEDPVKEKARDIISTLINIYNQNAIADKQVIADRTYNFINERITDISADLTDVDQSAEDFKTSQGVTDIASEANINLNVGANNRQELANTQTQYNIASSMKDLVDQQSGYEVLPSNLLNDPTIASTTEQYNQLVQQRNRLLKSADEKNPVIVNLDQQLNGLKQTMQASLGNTMNGLAMQVNTLSNQQAIINSKIYSAPGKERALRDITRKQQTTESLFLYLLQKREEAQIQVAASAPKSRIIDDAYYDRFPVSPKKKLIYLAFGLLGLLVPFGTIYVKDFLDTKIHNMYGLEKTIGEIPILGELPRISKRDKKIVLKDDRSVLAEALRIIRANLDYLLKGRRGQVKNDNVVYITSSVPGEGKTFLSVNLSMILASTKRRVLLVGADIRNPKFHDFFKSDRVNFMKNDGRKRSEHGLSEYLEDKDIEFKDIINTMLVHDNYFDVIYSGRIPSNPAELLMSERLGDLFALASQKYDYVIVDTAPMMMVSDTLMISQHANQLIYVVRADETEVRAVNFPMKLQEEGKIAGLSFVINDVKASNLGYGGKYGYGYGAPTKKWWKL